MKNRDLAVDFAKRANDEMAELVATYPDRFIAAAASLPMTDMEAALKELDRAILDLKLKGLQLFTPTLDKPLDSPEFLPLFQRMAEHDLPIWIHPVRWMDRAGLPTLKESKYYIYHVFGWPYETTAAMIASRLWRPHGPLPQHQDHCPSLWRDGALSMSRRS